MLAGVIEHVNYAAGLWTLSQSLICVVRSRVDFDPLGYVSDG